MEMTLLIEEQLVVVEVFLLVDVLDPKSLKDHRDFKALQDHKGQLVKDQMLQI